MRILHHPPTVNFWFLNLLCRHCTKQKQTHFVCIIPHLGLISSTHLRQALTLCAVLSRLKASQKFGEEHKMALQPSFSLYEIDPWTILVYVWLRVVQAF